MSWKPRNKLEGRIAWRRHAIELVGRSPQLMAVSTPLEVGLDVVSGRAGIEVEVTDGVVLLALVTEDEVDIVDVGVPTMT
jgi:hypothetical protein